MTQVVPIVFVVDSSGSMRYHGAIDATNRTARSFVERLRGVIGEESPGSKEIWFGVLECGGACIPGRTSPRWQSEEQLCLLDRVSWEDVEALGESSMATALEELSVALDALVSGATIGGREVLTPFVVFLSDGHMDDGWREALRLAETRKGFHTAMRISVPLGFDPDLAALNELSGESGRLLSEFDDLAKELVDSAYAAFVGV